MSLACCRITFGTCVPPPTGCPAAAAFVSTWIEPPATAGCCTLITVLMTVVLWMLLKMMLFGGGAT
jgi:hypothetical protein